MVAGAAAAKTRAHAAAIRANRRVNANMGWVSGNSQKSGSSTAVVGHLTMTLSLLPKGKQLLMAAPVSSPVFEMGSVEKCCVAQ